MKIFNLLLAVSFISFSSLTFSSANAVSPENKGRCVTAEDFINSPHDKEFASGCSFIDPRGCH